MSSIIPMFHTSCSLKQGGIFTTEKAGASMKGKDKRPNAPVSICDLAKENKLDKLVLISTNFIDFMAAYKNLNDVGCQMVFGLKIVLCEDLNVKTEESFKTESKIIVFLKNDSGYKNLINIYSKAATDGFYYIPRLDYNTLKELWSDDLILTLPFYSSFLAQNALTFSSIIPNFPCNPMLLKEVGNAHVHDDILNPIIDNYCVKNNLLTQGVKSIYYKKRDDAKKFMVWRAILNRTTYDKPNMNFMCSKEFCWESYKELV